MEETANFKFEKPPAIIIGCGGTGQEIVRRLYGRAQEKISEKTIRNLALEFLLVDTLSTQESRKELPELPPEDYIALGPLQLDAFIQERLKDEEYIKKWFNPRQYAGLMSSGAMQIRPFGRLALFQRLLQLYSKLDKKLRNVLNVKHLFPEEEQGRKMLYEMGASLQVHIVGSIAGGTGSGTMLDLAYLIRYMCSYVPMNITAHLVMPEVVEDIQIRDSIYANAYAFLKELDNFNIDPHLYSSGDSSPITTYLREKGLKQDVGLVSSLINRPFDYVYLLSPFNLGGMCFD